MSTITTNLGLIKPDPNELYDIGVHNGNSDKIDAGYGVTFCTSSTRPPTPQPKRIIFETDTLKGYGWDGDEWVQISTLSIAGALLQTIVDAKGDLLVASAADTVTRLAVGSTNSQLIADSADATGLRWSNNPPMRVVTLSDVASPSLAPTAGKYFKLTATGNRTVQSPSGTAEEGHEIILAHTASGGARTIAFNTTGAGSWKLPTGLTISATGSGLTDIIRAVYSASAARWCILDIAKGF